MTRLSNAVTAAAALVALAATSAHASSHREAPHITQVPKVDGTDFYMFRSYEDGRGDFTTLIANYVPLQDAYGGPNYFLMDPKALYEIHIDNDGDAVEDLTFQFEFTNTFTGLALNIGPEGEAVASGGTSVAIPLMQSGPFGASGPMDIDNLQVRETYSVTLVQGDRRSGIRSTLTNETNSGTTFRKPADYIGTKSQPDYEGYANGHIWDLGIPGCAQDGKVFVGQRREAFYLGLGEIFDLVNLNPLGDRTAGTNTIGDKNVTALALEIPTACLTAGDEPVIGAWTTASVRQARVQNPEPVGPLVKRETSPRSATVEGGAWTQVSRLGSPLVNEVVIGITDKDRFNASEPKDDLANFASYVTHPTLPALLNFLFGVDAPATPRNDLVAAFVTGITAQVGGNAFAFTQPAGGGAGEMLRLNTAIAPTAAANVSELAFLACDLGGFPNGRRPVDDVVDIALNVVLGAIDGTNANGVQTCDTNADGGPTVVNAGVVVNDGVASDPALLIDTFPYLATPLPGAVAALTQ